LYTETGWASWYGPGFQNRHAANGEPFDTERMTAAHRTLPLNSIARITNVKTGEMVVVRITDRGPFVSDRVLDLSRAAARRLSVYQRGTALVRIEVLQMPTPLSSGGRWCVQIGAFSNAAAASKLKDQLSRRYSTAKVLQFSSPTGESWLRVRVADDDKHRCQELMRETRTDAGVYLVRLDLEKSALGLWLLAFCRSRFPKSDVAPSCWRRDLPMTLKSQEPKAKSQPATSSLPKK
jgi:rare lipoprotein A